MQSKTPLKDYVVERPLRGIQTVLVRAKNKTEAKKLVDSNEQIVEVDFNINWVGKANSVTEE